MFPEKNIKQEKYYQNSPLFFSPKFIGAPCSSLPALPAKFWLCHLNASNFQEIFDSSIYQPLLHSLSTNPAPPLINKAVLVVQEKL